jgi:hypothetical protein
VGQEGDRMDLELDIGSKMEPVSATPLNKRRNVSD